MLAEASKLTCMPVDAVSLKNVLQYLCSIDCCLPCHSKWQHNMQISVHCPFYNWLHEAFRPRRRMFIVNHKSQTNIIICYILHSDWSLSLLVNIHGSFHCKQVVLSVNIHGSFHCKQGVLSVNIHGSFHCKQGVLSVNMHDSFHCKQGMLSVNIHGSFHCKQGV